MGKGTSALPDEKTDRWNKRRGEMSFILLFPISFSQKGYLARKAGNRQVFQGLLGKVNIELLDYSGLSLRTKQKVVD